MLAAQLCLSDTNADVGAKYYHIRLPKAGDGMLNRSPAHLP